MHGYSHKRGLAMALAAAGLITSGTAQAAQSAGCVTSLQAEQIAVAALPDALSSARSACMPHLPARSALAQSQARITQVYKPAAEAAWPEASRAFLASADLPLPPGADPAFVRPLLTTVITSLIEQGLKPDDCSKVDEFYTALEPLPPTNMGKLLVALMKLDAAGKKEDKESGNPFTICKDVAR